MSFLKRSGKSHAAGELSHYTGPKTRVRRMQIDLKALLHPRLHEEAVKLYENGHFKASAHEAMTQVEIALKEVSGSVKDTGADLVKRLFRTGEGGIKLVVPFGEHLQANAAELFRGAFTYYRNYTAHDGSKIDSIQSLRILVLASELLSLVNTSKLSYVGVGGAHGLVARGIFPDEPAVHRLLEMMDGYWMPEGVYDGFFEDLSEKGFSWEHVEALIDLGLIRSKTIDVEPDAKAPWVGDRIERYELTALGRAETKGIRPV